MFFKNRENENELHFSTLKGGEINGILIIPTIVDFKLVDLRVGESAYIETKFGSKRLLEEVSFIYNISDDFDGRFGYWVGDVRLSNVKLTRPKYCKTKQGT